MTDEGPETVQVVLNDQQMTMIEALCAEHGLGTPADALRHGLREYLAGTEAP